VRPFKGQPRKTFRGIKRLAENIEAIGQLTPIVVSPVKTAKFDYELIDGERRLRACRLAGIEIEAIVRRDPGAERYALSVASNFHRQKHDCLEICDAIQVLKKSGKTLKEISEIFGKSITFVMQHDSLVKLDPQVQQMLVAPVEGKKRERFGGSGRLSFSQALTLAPLPAAVQIRSATAITSKKMDQAEARRFVMKQSRAAGVAVGSITSAGDHINRIIRFIETHRSKLGEYNDMPYKELERIRVGSAPSERRRLENLIHCLQEDLALFAGAFFKEAKKRA
jgi:ParB/RepB/Spo0J family partition protein